MKKIKFNVPMELSEKELESIFDEAMMDVCGARWWKPESETDYNEAEQELEAEGAEIYNSTIFARMLFNGKKILLLDPESDFNWSGHKPGELLWNWQIQAEGCEPENGTWHAVGLKEITKGLTKYFTEGYASGCNSIQSLLEDGDFWDHDAVIQCAMYGEVIYG